MTTVLVVVTEIQAHEPHEMGARRGRQRVRESRPTISDPAFCRSVLPGASVRGANGIDAERPGEPDHGRAEDRVAIEDQILRRRVVGKGFTQLLHHPGSRRMERGALVNDVSAAVLDHEETEEQSERRRRNGEQVHRSDVVPVIAQERNTG